MGELFAPQPEKRLDKDQSEQIREDDATTQAAQERGEEVKADLDNLLDEIDGVLEENAAEFVKAYVQKGGQ